MNVYIVWRDEKWQDPELYEIFETEEDAKIFRDKVSSKRTKRMIESLGVSYYVLTHKVRLSEGTAK